MKPLIRVQLAADPEQVGRLREEIAFAAHLVNRLLELRCRVALHAKAAELQSKLAAFNNLSPPERMLEHSCDCLDNAFRNLGDLPHFVRRMREIDAELDNLKPVSSCIQFQFPAPPPTSPAEPVEAPKAKEGGDHGSLDPEIPF